MGQGLPLPSGGVRMEVPMRAGQQAQWPVSTIPIESLEAAAQDWYQFRDRSWRVKLYNLHAVILTVTIASVVLVGPARVVLAVLPGRLACRPVEGECRASDKMGCLELPGCQFIAKEAGEFCVPASVAEKCDPFAKGGLAGLLVMPAIVLGMMALEVYVKCYLVRQLRDEAQSRLAAPVAQTLAGTGWSVQAHSLVRNKGTRAPQPLEQGCISPGWIWLEFLPYAAQPVVGAPPPAALVAHPLPANTATGFVVASEEPGVARARELQPVLAYGSDAGARAAPLMADAPVPVVGGAGGV